MDNMQYQPDKQASDQAPGGPGLDETAPLVPPVTGPAEPAKAPQPASSQPQPTAEEPAPAVTMPEMPLSTPAEWTIPSMPEPPAPPVMASPVQPPQPEQPVQPAGQPGQPGQPESAEGSPYPPEQAPQAGPSGPYTQWEQTPYGVPGVNLPGGPVVYPPQPPYSPVPPTGQGPYPPPGYGTGYPGQPAQPMQGNYPPGQQPPYGPAYPPQGYPNSGYPYRQYGQYGQYGQPGQPYPAPGYGYPAGYSYSPYPGRGNQTLKIPAQPPAAMGPEADPNELVMRLAGQPMNQLQFARIQGYRPNKVLVTALVLLAGFMGLLSISMMGMNALEEEAGLIFLLGLVIDGLGFTGLALWRSGRRRQFMRQYAAYWEAHAEGVVTDLYPNRIEQYSRRCKTVLYFQPDTLFTQSRNLLVFKNPLPDGDSQMVVIRAQDVTPAQAQQFYEYVYHTCSPENRRLEGTFQPQRMEPLPLPVPGPAPQMVEGIPPLSYQPPKGNPATGQLDYTRPLLIVSPMAGVIFASIFAAANQITERYIFNWLIWFAGITLVCTLASQILPRLVSRAKTDKPGEVHMAVVQEGLIIFENGVERFYSPAAVRFAISRNILQLTTPDKTYDIPIELVPLGWEKIYKR